jgi:double zinc ribbon protein
MWICVGCHTENRDDRDHCWHCGTGKDAICADRPPIANSVEANNYRPSVCSKCSGTLDADAKFCPSCATPVLLYTPLNCPQCGKAVVIGNRFCKFCAFDLTQKPSAVGLSSKPQFGAGIEALLADKYHALSDSQLLATLRGDLSTQTEKSLSVALAELETRTSMDWRDLEVAKTNVKDAILGAHSRGTKGSISRSRSYDSINDPARERADKLVQGGGITAGVSALLFLWGYSYSSNLANMGRAAMMRLAGQSDSTYAFAQLCVTLGAIAFIIGVVLLIVGWTQR